MRLLKKKRSKDLDKDVNLSFHTFNTNDIDKEFFEENILPKSKRIVEFIKKDKASDNPLPYIDNAVLDLFSAYNRYYVEPLEKHHINSEYLLNYFAVKEILKMEDFKKIREVSKKDDFVSLLAVETVLEPFVSAIGDLKDKHKDLEGLVEKLKKAYEKAEEEADEEDLTKKEEDLIKKIEEGVANNLEKEDDFELRGALNESIEMINSLALPKKLFSLDSDNTFARLPYEDKLKTLEKLRDDKKINEVAILAGRLKAIYKKGRKSWTNEGMDHIRGITKGSDISSTLPDELSYINNSKYKKLFYKKVVDKDLRNYSYGSKRTKGKGPITALIDVSSSMRGPKETYSKATAMALLEVCRKQKRALIVIFFDSGRRAEDLHVINFGKAQLNNHKKLIDMITYFSGQGTMFQPPLERAKREISSSKLFKKSDIVFITDGESHLTDEFIEKYTLWRKTHKIRLYAIDVGKNKEGSIIHKLSDKVSILKNLEEETDNTSKELFRHLDIE